MQQFNFLGFVIVVAGCYIAVEVYRRLRAAALRRTEQRKTMEAVLKQYAAGGWRMARLEGAEEKKRLEDASDGWHNRPEVRRAYMGVDYSPRNREEAPETPNTNPPPSTTFPARISEPHDPPVPSAAPAGTDTPPARMSILERLESTVHRPRPAHDESAVDEPPVTPESPAGS